MSGAKSRSRGAKESECYSSSVCNALLVMLIPKCLDPPPTSRSHDDVWQGICALQLMSNPRAAVRMACLSAGCTPSGNIAGIIPAHAGLSMHRCWPGLPPVSRPPARRSWLTDGGTCAMRSDAAHARSCSSRRKASHTQKKPQALMWARGEALSDYDAFSWTTVSCASRGAMQKMKSVSHEKCSGCGTRLEISE